MLQRIKPQLMTVWVSFWRGSKCALDIEIPSSPGVFSCPPEEGMEHADLQVTEFVGGEIPFYDCILE